jgi:predicted alpha/beta-hydrolase family hydrolase
MPMTNDGTTFKVNVTGSDIVTAILYPSAKKNRAGKTLILGHGAGADQLSGFMRMVASGMAERGFDAMTFNFLYKEQKRGAPDPKAKLEACYRAVIDAATKHRKLKGNKLFIGGKSMGGRIASQVAAEDSAGIEGLVFLGYPLHPPGRPDKMRDEHLPKIEAPMLFVQGSRDAFGTEDEIRAIIKKHRLSATLFAIKGGDHSLKVPKSAGTNQQDIYQSVYDHILRWAEMI